LQPRDAVYDRRPSPRATAALTLAAVLTIIFFPAHQTVRTAGPFLEWDEDPAAIVTGYALTVDGVRTDYGLTPQPAGAPCGCSIPLPFSSGRHIVTVSAYNPSGETASAPLIIGPISNPGGPYSAQAGTAVTVSGANSTDNVGTITTYTWRWGDGTADTSGPSATASHTYASSGNFSITLIVADDFAASDSATTTATIITAPPQPPGTPASPNPANGATGVTTTPTLTWTASGATSYDVRFGTTNPPPLVASGQAAASYSPGALNPGTTYFWSIVANNSGGATAGSVWSFTTASAPATPTSPNPANGANGIGTTPTLTWSADNATSYDVQFGTNNPPPQVSSGQTSASYAPGTLTPTTTYYWRIVARNDAGATNGPVWSFTTSSGSTGGLPAPWLNQDIGNTGQTGSASYASGTFTVQGAGADIWGTSDAFQFVYQGIAGDAEIVARVASIQNTNTYAKAGVMIRESLAANAVHVMLDLNPTGNVEFETRQATGGTTSWLSGATQAGPAWLKLTRSGSTIVGSVSADGSNWRAVGSTTLSIATNAIVGLVLSSHDTTVLNTSTFDSVSVNVGVPPAPPGMPAAPNPGDGAAGVSNNPTLTWSSSGATSYDVGFGAANPPPQAATGQAASSYTPSTLTASTTYYWQVVAHNAAGATSGPVWSFTTAPASPAATDVVFYASDISASQLHGAWTPAADPTSPNGLKLTTANAGWSTISQPLAAPADYIDVPFTANADTPYTLWLRIRAINNDKYNDSVWVQFSDAQVSGSPVYPIGTTNGLLVNLATDSTATSLNGWGWKNGAYWLTQAATVTFPSNGTHTLRIQVREDGVELDQIVLSPVTYLSSPPGPPTNDSTIVKK
jgi:regulation of enolase protein 1 (concanavalin A-like superfamily)